tara:strand:+ start:700 stop:897 length:198 start_codon:yes stop_codon:yes gene_type:complete
MTYEKKDRDWGREKKLRKVLKGTDQVAKHRKSIYNMLSEQDLKDLKFDNEDSDVNIDYENYTKQR